MARLKALVVALLEAQGLAPLEARVGVALLEAQGVARLKTLVVALLEALVVAPIEALGVGVVVLALVVLLMDTLHLITLS